MRRAWIHSSLLNLKTLGIRLETKEPDALLVQSEQNGAALFTPVISSWIILTARIPRDSHSIMRSLDDGLRRSIWERAKF